MTREAQQYLEASQVIIGYTIYIELLREQSTEWQDSCTRWGKPMRT